MKFKIQGSALYLPVKKLDSNALDQQLGLAEGTLFNQSGVQTRHIVAEGETQAKMAKCAAEEALEQARCRFIDLDALICANGITQQLIPCNAALVQNEMGYGESGIACFDVNSTCLGFITALDMISCAFAAGRFKKVLLIVADTASVGLNWQHRESASLFGDAAAAFVLSASDKEADSTLLSAHMKTYAVGVDACHVKAGGAAKLGYHYVPEQHEEFLFAMDGPKVFKIAAKYMDNFFAEALAKANCTLDQIDYVIPHQASKSAIELMRRRLKIPQAKLYSILAQFGNCVAVSLPMALHEAIRTGTLQKGQTALLLGTGAGVSLGAIIIRY